mmetsp:Transcript_42215/g.68478  ORF Transcript_42215/g.68478 Transcript_42215/m.68478 type:complete len:245 (+) Transcript_42215:56-790(+)|eukprot:CAMPEP_0184644260 /NCGR_PEP_ID=MMETSP0308-20130426/1015_1 /TAXON_ID=38269 /ORGANISM="Gloeochaete witrockiana, Strain SAG 46.84" /LENGTH=244 /DNA_ID=CAMNT_0027072697 /DNA_START=9 /DNA_END=743 /DNA_ORIENTATION=-
MGTLPELATVSRVEPALFPPKTIFHVTGFGKFQTCTSNPTQTIIEGLRTRLVAKPLPPGCIVASLNVLETSGESALSTLREIFQLKSETDTEPLPQTQTLSSEQEGETVVLVHLGVDSSSSRFSLELQGKNEANFRCADEQGWQPIQQLIVPSHKSLEHCLRTSIPVYKLRDRLKAQGFNVEVSDDAGKFVCNFTYYHSLCMSQQTRGHSLFVHVPLFTTIEADVQFLFIRSLLCSIHEMMNTC